MQRVLDMKLFLSDGADGMEYKIRFLETGNAEYDTVVIRFQLTYTGGAASFGLLLVHGALQLTDLAFCARM